MVLMVKVKLTLMRFKTKISIVRSMPDIFRRYVVNVDCDGEDNFDDNDLENDNIYGERETDSDEVYNEVFYSYCL